MSFPSSTCTLHRLGHCKHCTECRLSHEIPGPSKGHVPLSLHFGAARYDDPAQGPSQPFSAAARPAIGGAATYTHAENQPCYLWKKTGACPRGDQCRYVHGSMCSQPHAAADDHHSRARRDVARLVRDAAAVDEQFQVRARAEAAVTLQRAISGSIITFAAGLEVHTVLTGFECCTVKIKNLPADTSQDDLTSLITQQGIDSTQFQLVAFNATQNGRKEADFVTTADLADRLSSGPDVINFKGEMVELKIGAYNVPGGMGASPVRDADVLTISWKAHSFRFIAEYDNHAQAQAQALALDGRMYAGRRLHAQMITPLPGRKFRAYNLNSIKIHNFPNTTTADDVRDFAQARRVRLMVQGGVWPIEDACARLLREIKYLSPHGIVSYKLVAQETRDGFVSYRVRFTTPEEARTVYNRLSGGIFPHISGDALRLRLPEPMRFNLNIPIEQYRAQQTLWNALVNSVADQQACALLVRQKGSAVRVQLSGHSKQLVGTLKVRVENLAGGEPLVGWHRSLALTNNTFFRRVFGQTGACLRSDWKRQVLRAYGEPRAVEHAKALVQAELARLEGLDYTVTLQRASVGYFVRKGIATLKELIGEDAVTFRPWARRITISGGEEARHHLTRLIDESLREGAHLTPGDGAFECPICFDSVSAPHRLGCGHMYCSACLRHFLVSAFEGGDQFPLVCLADKGSCARPIALPTIQAFLPQNKFLNLLESALEWYIRKHPGDIKRCRTSDCVQIYRVDQDGNALQCPSCFWEVCSACGEDAHRGISCEERRRIANWSLDDEWMHEHGFKKCSRCETPIEKTEGCNHMRCPCGAHLCWLCMCAFDDEDSTHNHLNTMH